MMVVLPAPVWPTMAAVSPGEMVKETPRRIHSMSASGPSGLIAASKEMRGSLRCASRCDASVEMTASLGRCDASVEMTASLGELRDRKKANWASVRGWEVNQTLRNSMEPELLPGMGWAGETMVGWVSRSLKTRSLAAMAAWRMLYFSLRSMIGRKKRWAYRSEERRVG